MALTITVTPDTANLPPRNLITVSGGGSATTAQVSRYDAAGNFSPVRAAYPAPLTGGGWVGYDYEAPYGQASSYSVQTTVGSSSTVAQAGPVTLNPQVPWLIHPGIPALSVPIRLMSAPTNRVQASGRGVHQPLGRSTPVVVSDGVRRAPTFDLTLGTSTLDQENALTQLLSFDAVLLLQVQYSNITRTLYDYVSVGDVSASPLIAGFFGDTNTEWTLPCTVTDAPVGLLQSQRTWNDVSAMYATWDDVAAAYATWNGVLTNTLGA